MLNRARKTKCKTMHAMEQVTELERDPGGSSLEPKPTVGSDTWFFSSAISTGVGGRCHADIGFGLAVMGVYMTTIW